MYATDIPNRRHLDYQECKRSVVVNFAKTHAGQGCLHLSTRQHAGAEILSSNVLECTMQLLDVGKRDVGILGTGQGTQHICLLHKVLRAALWAPLQQGAGVDHHSQSNRRVSASHPQCISQNQIQQGIAATILPLCHCTSNQPS